ncbi:clindamycin resistance transfer factor BtgA [Parabacteroides sp. 52]|uniref:BfmA/BtgA family mobilization protein n=1 Tax=unclassified Parabacteroides TaxID=2649774 RepID=UPI0013D4A31A|nr:MULTISPECIES: BfmA/BtgA family mobilization protein [unclassified Parabacteroides]MDH6534981.1 septal ring factor EnvC (AmiA/AmiB activator) [Parabacteroides sp. PM5-20]NDV55241.1 clindamycin resistance transfer factor BtgA [Parabacteroides sp. 52]
MKDEAQKIIYTTVSIDKETGRLVEKICKRYSLKKSEVVKLAFGYIDKAHINPADAPESVKSELSKINKRQDDIIRFIRHYEEEQLNPMIRTSHSIAVKFDTAVGILTEKVNLEINTSKDNLVNVLKKLDEHFGKIAVVINNQSASLDKLSATIDNHSKTINSQTQVQQRNNQKLLKLISLYSELATCGVMDGKRKENLRTEINDLINE